MEIICKARFCEYHTVNDKCKAHCIEHDTMGKCTTFTEVKVDANAIMREALVKRIK